MLQAPAVQLLIESTTQLSTCECEDLLRSLITDSSHREYLMALSDLLVEKTGRFIFISNNIYAMHAADYKGVHSIFIDKGRVVTGATPHDAWIRALIVFGGIGGDLNNGQEHTKYAYY